MSDNVVEGRFIGNIRPEPAAALRAIADDIDAGRYGPVQCLTVALLADKTAVFGAGPDSTPELCAIVARRGARELERIAIWDRLPGSSA